MLQEKTQKPLKQSAITLFFVRTSAEQSVVSETESDEDLFLGQSNKKYQKIKQNENNTTSHTEVSLEANHVSENVTGAQDTILTRDNEEQLSQELNETVISASPPKEPIKFKRLRRLADIQEDTEQRELAEPTNSDVEEEFATTTEQVLTSDSENEAAIPDSEFLNQNDPEDELDEEQAKQASKDDWLKRVTDTLYPLSARFKYSEDLRLRFMQLKKQWGYTKYYKQVDAKNTDCPLCDHQHVATLFKIYNFFTKNKLKTGSHCITQFRVLNEAGDGLLSKEASKAIIDQDIQNSNSDRGAHRREVRGFIL